MSWLSTRSLGALLGLGLALAPTACQSDADQRVALAELGDKCVINSDCQESLICAFQLCHEACTSSRDCAHGTRCVEGHNGNNVCQLNDERSCSTSKPCPGAETCGVDAQCRDQCTTASDCVDQQLCASGTCADATELDASGVLTAVDSRPSSLPEPCAYDSDCPEKQLCHNATCRAQCAVDTDCPGGQACTDEECVAPAAPSGCVYNSDCAKDEQCSAGACQKLTLPPQPECTTNQDCATVGQSCQAGRCRCECSTDAECGLGQTCDGGCACVAGAVLHGDVYVSDSAQLAALQNVTQIMGRLEIRISGASSALHVPNLRSVGDLYVNPDHGGRLEVTFDALVTGKSLNCPALCNFPKLEHATGLSMSAEGKLELVLASTGNLAIWGTMLTEISLPKLVSDPAQPTDVTVQFLPLLTRFSAPLLQDVSQLTLSDDPELSVVSLPALRTDGYLTLSNVPKLTELDLHSLTTSYQSLSISNTGLTDLDTLDPGLDSAIPHGSLTNGGEGIQILNNVALSSCLVTQLQDHVHAQGKWVFAIGNSGNLEPAGGCP